MMRISWDTNLGPINADKDDSEVMEFCEMLSTIGFDFTVQMLDSDA